MENGSKREKAKRKMQKFKITAKQYAEHRRRYPVLDSFRDSSLARIFTDEFEMKLWNTLLSCDDPTIVQDTLALARAYGLRVSKKGSGR